MTETDKPLIARLALHMAEELGQLGFHEERWYDAAQRRKFERYAKNVLTMLRNEGFIVQSQ